MVITNSIGSNAVTSETDRLFILWFSHNYFDFDRCSAPRANGRLISILNFDFGPASLPARMSCSVKRASRISPSVERLRSYEM